MALKLNKRKKKVKVEYESEQINYKLSKRYRPDFILTFPSGKKIYIEAKGYFRYEDQAKMKAVKETNPDLDIRFFFPNDGKVQTSDMTNSEWCAKFGFPCAIYDIPEDWFTDG